ncbi:unnamed protein product [Rhizoctonia solani]|uniref:Uncharacterized protein n=1 Tax=Rhizoctonia solani TaxID=456999 RepID=A0A8H3DPA9_9AGAM|nr:unnamed protein product [Rhizoctonia solani]
MVCTTHRAQFSHRDFHSQIMLERFTGGVRYLTCRMAFSVIKAVEKGTLPIRPKEQLRDDQRGDLVWQLLLKCGSREIDERPSAGQVADTFETRIDRA